MESNRISVIIPVYKTQEKQLCKSIESVANQSYQNLEILLVDDGSPDQCGKICDFYASQDERIKVIHKENGGVSSARNCGLDEATGDYIFFVDSDDSLSTDAIEKLVHIAKNTKADITICSCSHIKQFEEQCSNKNVEREYLKTVGLSEAICNLAYNVHVFDELETTAVWGKLYNKTNVQSLRFCEKMSIGEDFVFNYCAILNSKAITYCNLKLYNYNYTENSLMNNKSYSPKVMQSFNALIEFEKNYKDTVHYEDLVARCVNIAFTVYLKIPKKQFDNCAQIEEYIKKNRKKVLHNRKTSGKVKVAICISYISFKLLRKIFNLVKEK